jgi:hypothetical protein
MNTMTTPFCVLLPFSSGAVLLFVMSVQRRRNESVMSIVMKVRLASSSLFLPEEVAVNAISVDFQQDPMVGLFYQFRAWNHSFSVRPSIGCLSC